MSISSSAINQNNTLQPIQKTVAKPTAQGQFVTNAFDCALPQAHFSQNIGPYLRASILFGQSKPTPFQFDLDRLFDLEHPYEFQIHDTQQNITIPMVTGSARGTNYGSYGIHNFMLIDSTFAKLSKTNIARQVELGIGLPNKQNEHDVLFWLQWDRQPIADPDSPGKFVYYSHAMPKGYTKEEDEVIQRFFIQQAVQYSLTHGRGGKICWDLTTIEDYWLAKKLGFIPVDDASQTSIQEFEAGTRNIGAVRMTLPDDLIPNMLNDKTIIAEPLGPVNGPSNPLKSPWKTFYPFPKLKNSQPIVLGWQGNMPLASDGYGMYGKAAELSFSHSGACTLKALSTIYLNGQTVTPNEIRPLELNDELQLGAWTYLYTPEGLHLISGNDSYRELFPIGLKNLTFSQGKIGNCFLLASIWALSQNIEGKKLLAALIKHKNSDYKVYFPGTHVTITLPPHQASMSNGVYTNTFGINGIHVLERAYAELRGKYALTPKASLEDSTKGGHIREAMQVLTGWKMIYPSYDEVTRDIFGVERYVPEEWKGCFKLKSENPQRYIMTAGTLGNESDPSVEVSGNLLHPQHAYAVQSINESDQTINIVDPHNTSHIITIGYQDFFKCFGAICMFEVPSEGAMSVDTHYTG